jgi:hypothetical protein
MALQQPRHVCNSSELRYEETPKYRGLSEMSGAASPRCHPSCPKTTSHAKEKKVLTSMRGSVVLGRSACRQTYEVAVFENKKEFRTDLGSDTAKVAAEMTQFDPSSGWESRRPLRGAFGRAIGRIMRLGFQPVNVGLQFYGGAVHPPGGSPWSLRMQIAFLFPKMPKKT